MPRTARAKSASNIYHIMLRGNNRQVIFREPEDYNKFLAFLDAGRKEKSFFLYAWCLMPNHAHLLLKENRDPLSIIFRRLLTGYVVWYNAKYGRTGHLFESRFRSRPVEDETYFLRVVRYIHRNPSEAGLCEKMEEYPYSSYSNYFRNEKYKDNSLIFGLMTKGELERYHLQKDEDDDFLRFDDPHRLSDAEIIRSVIQSGMVSDISEIKTLPHHQQILIVQMLLHMGVSYRQISNLTGIRLGLIRTVSKDLHQQ